MVRCHDKNNEQMLSEIRLILFVRFYNPLKLQPIRFLWLVSDSISKFYLMYVPHASQEHSCQTFFGMILYSWFHEKLSLNYVLLKYKWILLFLRGFFYKYQCYNLVIFHQHKLVFICLHQSWSYSLSFSCTKLILLKTILFHSYTLVIIKKSAFMGPFDCDFILLNMEPLR